MSAVLTDDIVAAVGHQIHICRFREARTLLRWLGTDLRGQVVLDVAGGDGYWAGRARRRGARAVSVDLARRKMLRGRRLRSAPALLEADAHLLPVRSASADKVMSVCAIEHFDDGPAALSEMARVLRPGGELVLSADALTLRGRWPHLFAAHRDRYHVQRTYRHDQLAELFGETGLDMVEHSYQFRGGAAERGYLTLSAYGGRFGFNAAAPLAPAVALNDARRPNTGGGIVLVRARKPA